MALLATSERKASKPKFCPDPKRSTFRWEIDMTNDGVNRVASIEGYSKGAGFEATNKSDLLIRKLDNPILPYLRKADEIRIYENLTELPSGQWLMRPKDTQPLLIRLDRDNYHIYDWVRHVDPIKAKLDELITYMRQGSVPERPTGRRKNVWHAELNHADYQFDTIDELKAFCRSLMPKYGKDCMTKWWVAHLDIQPELTKTSADQAADQPMQQLAQGLANKYSARS